MAIISIVGASHSLFDRGGAAIETAIELATIAAAADVVVSSGLFPGWRLLLGLLLISNVRKYIIVDNH